MLVVADNVIFLGGTGKPTTPKNLTSQPPYVISPLHAPRIYIVFAKEQCIVEKSLETAREALLHVKNFEPKGIEDFLSDDHTLTFEAWLVGWLAAALRAVYSEQRISLGIIFGRVPSRCASRCFQMFSDHSGDPKTSESKIRKHPKTSENIRKHPKARSENI